MNELFFVGIKDPIEVRKELLTSSKQVIDSLKRYERYKNINDEKRSTILQLKRVFDELLILNKKMRGKFPSTPSQPARTQVVREAPKPPKRSNLDVLEDELSRIEDRLKALE